jgi:GeoRSP system SPASM domain protein
MNLRDLARPIRIYWDLPVGSSDSDLCVKVCDDIVEIKILFLSLRDTASATSQCCIKVIDALRGRNIGLSLAASGSALTPALAGRLAGLSVKKLLAEASSLNDVRSLIENTGGDGKEDLPLGISFEVGQGNYRELPEVVSFCMNNGIRDLVFPIQRLETGKDFFYVGKREREEISRRLGGMDHSMIQMTIHDPFLWDVFFPNTDYHEGGCQAANSMLYISPSYKVYPCPAMPLELGDLHETSLREIVLSGKKKQLRNSLLSPPGECSACDRAGKCLGGCRGRAYAMTGSLNRCDPACR